MTDINDIGLQLSAMLREGKRLDSVVAKHLRKELDEMYVAGPDPNGKWWIWNGDGTVSGPYDSQQEASLEATFGKAFSAQLQGDGGVVILEDGQQVAGPFYDESDLAAFQPKGKSVPSWVQEQAAGALVVWLAMEGYDWIRRLWQQRDQ